MRFFVPGTQTPEETEIIYNALRTRAENIALRVTERKIQSVLYKRNNKLFSMSVGLADPVKKETVIAIFEGFTVYLVFTPNRGVIWGNPYIIGTEEILSVEEFEP